MKFFLNLILLTLVTTNLYATDISIENSSIRMMPPGVPMTAGYFLISNNTNKDIILTGVRSSSFKSIEMHNTIKDGDVMKLDIDPKSHPAWTGVTQKLQDKGRVSKFNKRFANLKKA